MAVAATAVVAVAFSFIFPSTSSPPAFLLSNRAGEGDSLMGSYYYYLLLLVISTYYYYFIVTYYYFFCCTLSSLSSLSVSVVWSQTSDGPQYCTGPG